MGYSINSSPVKSLRPPNSLLLKLAAKLLQGYILPAIRIQHWDKIYSKVGKKNQTPNSKYPKRSFRILMHELILLTTEISYWGCNCSFRNPLLSHTLKTLPKILKLRGFFSGQIQDSTFRITEELLTLRVTNNSFWLLKNNSNDKTIFSVSDKMYRKPKPNRSPASGHLFNIATKLHIEINE